MLGKNIGRMRDYAVKNLALYGLTPLRNILPPAMFREAWPRTPRASTVLIPEVVFWLMATVALNEQAMAGAMAAFWAHCRGSLPYLSAEPVTEEAFCIARKKLKLRFFRTVYHQMLRRFEQTYPHRYRWKGFRLLGIDGMKMTLPKSAALREVFPPASNQLGSTKTPQALLVGLVGLWDGLCRDFKLVSSKTSEQRCARKLIRQLEVGDLLMCDKNFADYHTLALVVSQGGDFLFHLPDNRFHKSPRIVTESGRKDEWYVILCLPKHLCQEHPEFPAALAVRVIRYQRPGFRPSHLITSLLNVELYPHDELVGLYHERWRHETMHREWKYSLSMSNLRSLSVKGIRKEIYVQLTLNNALRWLMTEAVGENCRPVDIQFLETKRLVVAYLTAMSAAPTAWLPYIYKQLLEEIGRKKICIRPGRSYPRKNDTTPRNKGNGKYAKTAKIQQNYEDKDVG